MMIFPVGAETGARAAGVDAAGGVAATVSCALAAIGIAANAATAITKDFIVHSLKGLMSMADVR